MYFIVDKQWVEHNRRRRYNRTDGRRTKRMSSSTRLQFWQFLSRAGYNVSACYMLISVNSFSNCSRISGVSFLWTFYMYRTRNHNNNNASNDASQTQKNADEDGHNFESPHPVTIIVTEPPDKRGKSWMCVCIFLPTFQIITYDSDY